jgi:hypothetical protein
LVRCFWFAVERGVEREQLLGVRGVASAWLLSLSLSAACVTGTGVRVAGVEQFPTAGEPRGGGCKWFAALVYDVALDLEVVDAGLVVPLVGLVSARLREADGGADSGGDDVLDLLAEGEDGDF